MNEFNGVKKTTPFSTTGKTHWENEWERDGSGFLWPSLGSRWGPATAPRRRAHSGTAGTGVIANHWLRRAICADAASGSGGSRYHFPQFINYGKKILQQWSRVLSFWEYMII